MSESTAQVWVAALGWLGLLVFLPLGIKADLPRALLVGFRQASSWAGATILLEAAFQVAVLAEAICFVCAAHAILTPATGGWI